MTSLNAPEEVYLADKLCEIHPWADSVRFARTGGETCAMAVRIARATTGRDVVAICGYHGWSDWYLACNIGETDALDGIHLAGLEPAGVPYGLKDTAVTFHYNDFEEFDAIIRQYGDRLACVIMEPMRSTFPKEGFLEHIRDEIHRVGGLLIFDEITTGWRCTFGGVHKVLGVDPDMATFAKAMGNGHPIGAVIGTKAAMDGSQKSFISSTYWTEAVGPTAALASIEKMEKTSVWDYVARVGSERLGICSTKIWRRNRMQWNSMPGTFCISAICNGTENPVYCSHAEGRLPGRYRLLSYVGSYGRSLESAQDCPGSGVLPNRRCFERKQQRSYRNSDWRSRMPDRLPTPDWLMMEAIPI